MADKIPAAFPFVIVSIDLSGLQPVAQRSPGVIAIVGWAEKGQAETNTPIRVSTTQDVNEQFGWNKGETKVEDLRRSPLHRSLMLALLQDPKPYKIYGVRVASKADAAKAAAAENDANYAAGLACLEGLDDVTFVSLAGATDKTVLGSLKKHIEETSANGLRRIGVAMVSPALVKIDSNVGAKSYVERVKDSVDGLKSDFGRMIIVAARGAQLPSSDEDKNPPAADVATAAMAAIAGYDPHISMVLKPIAGFSLPAKDQFGPTEIINLSEEGINPIIDPALIVGESLHFADGRTYSSKPSLGFIDIVRVLDDIEFRLKAGLIGLVGDARITKSGLTLVKARVASILEPLKVRAVIDDYAVDIPVLNSLSIPEAARSPADSTFIQTARANRKVDLLVSITYGPAVHQLVVKLAPKF